MIAADLVLEVRGGVAEAVIVYAGETEIEIGQARDGFLLHVDAKLRPGDEIRVRFAEEES